MTNSERLAVKRDMMAEIAVIQGRILREDMRIVSYARAGSDIDDESDKPEGWTQKKFRVARDARRATADAPVYLKMSARRVEALLATQKHTTHTFNVHHSVEIPTRLTVEEEHQARDAIDVETVSGDDD